METIPEDGPSFYVQKSSVSGLGTAINQGSMLKANLTSSAFTYQTKDTEVHEIYSPQNPLMRYDNTVIEAYSNQANKIVTKSETIKENINDSMFDIINNFKFIKNNKQESYQTERTENFDIYSQDNYVKRLPQTEKDVLIQNASNQVTNKVDSTIDQQMMKNFSYQTQSSEVHQVYNKKEENLTDLNNPITEKLLEDAYNFIGRVNNNQPIALPWQPEDFEEERPLCLIEDVIKSKKKSENLDNDLAKET